MLFYFLPADVADGMVQYVRKNMPLISKELISVRDVEAFIDRSDYTVIGVVVLYFWFYFSHRCPVLYLIFASLFYVAFFDYILYTPKTT